MNKKTIYNYLSKQIHNNEPITFYYPFGGYKLWRLKEAPEPDWAELFAMLHIAQWLKPLLANYKPGVRFEFWLHEIIIPRLNNIPRRDTDIYLKTFRSLISFIQNHAPKNLHFSIFLERDRYENGTEFEIELQNEIDKIDIGDITLTKDMRSTISLNVKATPEQLQDPQWQEKNHILHQAYHRLRSQKGHQKKYYGDAGLVAFPILFELTNLIPIGTCRASKVKFWVGAGLLEKRQGRYVQRVLSKSQCENITPTNVTMAIDGLSGKNFLSIKILDKDMIL